MAKRLINIFRRGAAAMQNEIVQDTDVSGVSFFQYRTSNRFPSSHITAAQCTSLAGVTAAQGYKCNTAFTAFHTRWQHPTFRVAAYLTIGNDNPSRSHFYEQDRIDAGGEEYATQDNGWWNRWSGDVDIRTPVYNLDLMTIGPQAARSIIGDVTLYAATATGKPQLNTTLTARAAAAMAAMSEQPTFAGAVARDNCESMLATNGLLDSLVPKVGGVPTLPALPSDAIGSGVSYPADSFGANMKLLAQLLQLGLASRVIAIDNAEGWDHHQDMGGSTGSPAGTRKHQPLLTAFNQTMEAFIFDLEANDLEAETTIVCQTEFHRTMRENGTFGTDHGHAGHAYVWSASITSGLYGAPLDFRENQNPADPWPTTIYTNPGGWNSAANNRFLRRTIDYRDFQRMQAEWLRGARLSAPQMETIWGPLFSSEAASSVVAPQYNALAIT